MFSVINCLEKSWGRRREKNLAFSLLLIIYILISFRCPFFSRVEYMLKLGEPCKIGSTFILLVKSIVYESLIILSPGHISEKLGNFFYDVIMTS